MSAPKKSVARLWMNHCGCHVMDPRVFISKHPKKEEYQPSHLTSNVPVIKKHYSKHHPKGLRTSDDSKSKVIPLSRPVRKIVKPADSPLRRAPRPSELLKRSPERDDIIDLHSTRKSTRKVSSFDKPRLSDAFLLRRPKDVIVDEENLDEAGERSGDHAFSHIPEIEENSLRFKPRPSDAFLLRIPKEHSSDADDESTSEFLRSRRIPERTPTSPLRKATRPKRREVLRTEPIFFDNTTEDDDLMKDDGMMTVDPDQIPSQHALYTRIKVKDDGVYFITKYPPLVPKVKKHRALKIVAERDPTAKVISFSFDKDVLYKDDCPCGFCSLLKQFGGSPLMFNREYNTMMGHGFYPKL